MQPSIWDRRCRRSLAAHLDLAGPARNGPAWPCTGWGLPRPPCHHGAGALLPHHFTLTGEAIQLRLPRLGGVVSVALSLGFPRVGATDHPCPLVSGLSSKAYLLDREAGEAAPPRLPGLRPSILAAADGAVRAARRPPASHDQAQRRADSQCDAHVIVGHAAGERHAAQDRAEPGAQQARRRRAARTRARAWPGARRSARPARPAEQQSEAEPERHEQRQRPGPWSGMPGIARTPSASASSRKPSTASGPRHASPTAGPRAGPPRPPRARSA